MKEGLFFKAIITLIPGDYDNKKQRCDEIATIIQESVEPAWNLDVNTNKYKGKERLLLVGDIFMETSGDFPHRDLPSKKTIQGGISYVKSPAIVVKEYQTFLKELTMSIGYKMLSSGLLRESRISIQSYKRGLFFFEDISEEIMTRAIKNQIV